MPQIYELITENAERTASDPEGRTWYELDPDTVYPWTIAQIQAAVTGGGVPPTIRDLYLPRAQALPAEAWALAATPRDEVVEGDLALRAEALELIRLWATELHHGATGYQPRGIHIASRPAWRM